MSNRRRLYVLLSLLKGSLKRATRSRSSRQKVAAELRKAAWFGGLFAAVVGQLTDSYPVLGSVFVGLWLVGFQFAAVIWENLAVHNEEA